MLPEWKALSHKERAAAWLLVRGVALPQIGERLGVRLQEVESLLRHVYDVFRVNSKEELLQMTVRIRPHKEPVTGDEADGFRVLVGLHVEPVGRPYAVITEIRRGPEAMQECFAFFDGRPGSPLLEDSITSRVVGGKIVEDLWEKWGTEAALEMLQERATEEGAAPRDIATLELHDRTHKQPLVMIHARTSGNTVRLEKIRAKTRSSALRNYIDLLWEQEANA
jgi:DNA-binding CsgD family transcriptional regulator